MGFNISGLVINKSFRGKEDEIASFLKARWEKVGEIDFEQASENYKDSGLADVYFGESGTLVFMDTEDAYDPWPIPNVDTFSFILLESSMAFNVALCRNGEVIRRAHAMPDEDVIGRGEPTQLELESTDLSDYIWKQIGELLGQSFWEIEPNEKCIRFRVV